MSFRSPGGITIAAATIGLLVAVLTSCVHSSDHVPDSTAPSRPASTATAPNIPAPTQPTHWLCRPGMSANPCEGNLDTTVIAADGSRTDQRFTPAAHPSVDCFYVYPTVSSAPGNNAPLASSPEIVTAVRAQAALFAQVCRLFVPLYRQNTLSAVASGRLGSSDLAYGDIASAWHDYLLHDNGGRGVVLIGHSQGAIVLRRLIQTEIDGQPAIRARLVSAILPGANVSVPPEADVGGDFRHIPACRRGDQTGCVLAWSTFASAPPTPALFGRVGGGRHVLCTNPAALGGGSATLHPVLPTDARNGITQSARLGTFATGFVAFTDAVTGSCQQVAGANVLIVHGALGGHDVSTLDRLGPTWGLHVLDVNIVLGDLVNLVSTQAVTFTHP